jgi:hypothetical protein
MAGVKRTSEWGLVSMFGLIGDRLRRWLSGSSKTAEGDPAVTTAGLPEPLEMDGSSGNSANGLSNNGSTTEAVGRSDGISPIAGQVKLKESMKEAPGVTKPHGDSQTAN